MIYLLGIGPFASRWLSSRRGRFVGHDDSGGRWMRLGGAGKRGEALTVR